MKSNREKDNEMHGNNESGPIDDAACENPFDNQDQMVVEVQNIVQDLCCLCSFITNSTKCIEKMKALQKQLYGSNDTLKINLDVRTRWN